MYFLLLVIRYVYMVDMIRSVMNSTVSSLIMFVSMDMFSMYLCRYFISMPKRPNSMLFIRHILPWRLYFFLV